MHTIVPAPSHQRRAGLWLALCGSLLGITSSGVITLCLIAGSTCSRNGSVAYLARSIDAAARSSVKRPSAT